MKVPLIINLPGLAALTAILNCGEPLTPTAGSWVLYDVFPAGYYVRSLTANENDGALYMVTVKDAVYNIMKYYGREFSIEYEIPAGRTLTLEDVSCSGNNLWAAGAEEIGGRWKPYVIRRTSRGGWEEVTLEPHLTGGVVALYAVSEKECWFVINTFYEGSAGRKSGLLVKYENGNTRILKGLPAVFVFVDVTPKSAISGVYDIYAVEDKETAAPANQVAVFYSRDGGKNWAKENIKTYTPFENIIKDVAAGYANNGVLYLAVEFPNGYEGILKRTATNIKSEYTLEFFANRGPLFSGVSDIGVQDLSRDPRENRAIVAVGPNTSVYGENGAWVLEEVPYPVDLKYVAKGTPRGFWAVGQSNVPFSPNELYFHD